MKNVNMIMIEAIKRNHHDQWTLMRVLADMFPRTAKRGFLTPVQKLPEWREPLEFKGFSAPSYLVCVSSTTVSIPLVYGNMSTGMAILASYPFSVKNSRSLCRDQGLQEM